MPEPLSFVYRNWRQQEAMRHVLPRRVYKGSTEWHPQEQWLLEALDVEKNETRTFALASVVFWPDGPEALAAWLSGETVAVAQEAVDVFADNAQLRSALSAWLKAEAGCGGPSCNIGGGPCCDCGIASWEAQQAARKLMGLECEGV